MFIHLFIYFHLFVCLFILFFHQVVSNIEKYPTLREEQASTQRKLIVNQLDKACKKSQYLLGMLTTSFNVTYLCILVCNVSDPCQKLRHGLHKQELLHTLRAGESCLEEVEILTSMQPQLHSVQECVALVGWLTLNVKTPYQVIVRPEDEVVLDTSGHSPGQHDVFAQLQSAVSSMNLPTVSETADVPVVVFIRKVSSAVVRFESYLQLCLQKYADKKFVIFVFHAENMTEKKCPNLEVDGCRVSLFSAFNPRKRPVSVIMATVEKDNM